VLEKDAAVDPYLSAAWRLWRQLPVVLQPAVS